MKKYYWLNKDSKAFLKRGYLEKDESPKQRVADIATAAEKYLKVKETETGGRCTPYEQPVKIRMKINNVGVEFATQDILHNKKNIKQVMF